jgi:hypothetical protein
LEKHLFNVETRVKAQGNGQERCYVFDHENALENHRFNEETRVKALKRVKQR